MDEVKLRSVLTISFLSVALGVAGSVFAHRHISRPQAWQSMNCFGNTVYLNGMMVMRSTYPDLEPGGRLYNFDSASMRYLRLVAARVKSTLPSGVAQGDVYLIPFQQGGRGWPLKSSVPYSRVFIQDYQNGKFNVLELPEDGGSIFQLGAFIANAAILTVAAFPLGILSTKFWVWHRDRRRIRPGCCLRCGYDLTGNLSGVCSECGLAKPPPPSV